MHNITLYGLTKASYDTLSFTNKLADKTDVNGVKSVSYDLDCLWLRPGMELESETKTGAGNILRNDGIFRRKFEIDVFPQENQSFDQVLNNLRIVFGYYSTFIGINNFLYNPFAGILDTDKAMPVTIMELGYEEVNSVYRTITLELRHKL